MSPSGSFPVLVIVVRLIVALIDVWLRVVSACHGSGSLPEPLRHICPPRLKLSSTIPTRRPHSAARAAAAMPAGPPPTYKNVEMMSGCAHFIFSLRSSVF